MNIDRSNGHGAHQRQTRRSDGSLARGHVVRRASWPLDDDEQERDVLHATPNGQVCFGDASPQFPVVGTRGMHHESHSGLVGRSWRWRRVQTHRKVLVEARRAVKPGSPYEPTHELARGDGELTRARKARQTLSGAMRSASAQPRAETRLERLLEGPRLRRIVTVQKADREGHPGSRGHGTVGNTLTPPPVDDERLKAERSMVDRDARFTVHPQADGPRSRSCAERSSSPSLVEKLVRNVHRSPRLIARPS